MSISALKEKFNSLTLESENHWDYRGNNNSERDYVHGFCTYPAMMVPKMQREMLDVCLEHLQDTSIRLLDPFAGSGTILVEGMLRGLNIVGIDINPLAILLCKAKTTILNPTTLHEKTVQLFTWITIHDKTPLYKFDGINKWFTNQAISDLSRIRAGIIAEETIEYRRFFWASFCEVVRIVSNSRDCTYKLHIKEKKDIDAYAVDAVDLFKTTLQYNIAKYNEFYSELQKRGHLKKDGSAYKGQVKIVLSDSIAYLNHSKQKYSLVFTSPPYGDNHTTVSYGQYSIMPLRWINYHDIDEAVDETLLATLYEIDNQSLGGKSSNKALTPARKKVVKKSETLKIQLNQINNLASQQSNKIIAFYSDYDRFLAALSRKMKSNAISVWTLGNRKVAKQEIFMDKIMIELCKPYHMQLLTNFTRQILNKLYGDNVIEKHGINRDRTGDREKTRYLCGKQGIFTRDRALIRPGFIRQLETRASTRSASFFHALGSPGRPHNGGGAAGAYCTSNGAKPLKQGHLRAKRGPLGPSRKSQQQTKRTGFAAHGHSIAETAPEGKRASCANGALIRA